MNSEKQAILEQVVSGLRSIDGVKAICLGGSEAAGTTQADSDIDIGIYYLEHDPFSIPALRKLASKLDPDLRVSASDFYSWGPWVNGGAWLTMNRQRVDIIYRNVDQIQRVISDCERGQWISDYYQQPTYGFHSYIYLAEVQVCQPLYDPEDILPPLKSRVSRYPEALKSRLMESWMWSARSDLYNLNKCARRGDVYNTTGSITRIISFLNQALFALNERYFLSDKGVMEIIESFPLCPESYKRNVEQLLADASRTALEMQAKANIVVRLVDAVGKLCPSVAN